MKRDLAPEPVDEALAGQVVSLRSLDSRGSRFELRFPGGELVVSAELIADFKLRAGAHVPGAEASRLVGAAYDLRVFDRAVSLLAIRARSARNLRLALRQRGATAEAASAAIDRLLGLGLLDDAAFARGLAAGRAGSRGMSRRRLQQVLVQKGVAPGTAGEAVEEALGDTDEFEAALEVATRRLRSLRDLDPTTRRRRLHGFLARRGFDGDTARRVLARLLAGEPGA